MIVRCSGDVLTHPGPRSSFFFFRLMDSGDRAMEIARAASAKISIQRPLYSPFSPWRFYHSLVRIDAREELENTKYDKLPWWIKSCGGNKKFSKLWIRDRKVTFAHRRRSTKFERSEILRLNIWAGEKRQKFQTFRSVANTISFLNRTRSYGKSWASEIFLFLSERERRF